MRTFTGENLFAVGEYWSTDLGALNLYEQRVNGGLSLFDFPLHYNLYSASEGPLTFDMRKILDNTWVQANPVLAVTFVDNHDTQSGQSGSTFVKEWFRDIAYAILLTRQDGYPCIFYPDYYGSNGTLIDGKIKSMRPTLVALLTVRKNNAYGREHDYFSNPDEHYVGWTSEGDESHGGLATVISTAEAPQGYLDMYVGTRYGGQFWTDAMGRFPGQRVLIAADGNGHFLVTGRNVTVWVPE